MRKRGFTLIELLVVIAIIAILAAILFPVLSNAKERGKSATCTSNLRSLGTACTMYADDNGGRFPICYWTKDSSWTDYHLWFFEIPSYVAGAHKEIKAWDQFKGVQNRFQCPSMRRCKTADGNDRIISYAMNMGMDSAFVSQIVRPSKTILLVDGGPDIDGNNMNYGVYQPDSGPYWKQCQLAIRHNDRANIVMCDGRVQSVSTAFDYYTDVAGTHHPRK